MPLPATVDNILHMYLYGTDEKPVELRDRLRDHIDLEDTVSITIDHAEYMTTVGRYANLARSELVQAFFNGDVPEEWGTRDANNTWSVTIGELRNNPALAFQIDFTVSHYNTDPQSADFVERAFIWGTTGFVISDSTTLVMDGNGLRVENSQIVPQPDNFDFNSNNAYIQIANDNVFEPNIDPFHIGRTLEILFGSVSSPVPGPSMTAYGLADFTSDSTANDAWFTPVDAGAAAYHMLDLANQIISSGAVEYERDDFNIVYDDNNQDYIEVDSSSIVVGGLGTDFILGSDEKDIIYGNEESDTIFGNGGHDVLDGGIGDDDGGGQIYGGDGADFIRVIDGNVYGDAGNDCILVGGVFSNVYGGLGNDYIRTSDFSTTVFTMSFNDGHDYVDAGSESEVFVNFDGTPLDWTYEFYLESVSTEGEYENDNTWFTRDVSGDLVVKSLSGNTSFVFEDKVISITTLASFNSFNDIDLNDLFRFEAGEHSFADWGSEYIQNERSWSSDWFNPDLIFSISSDPTPAFYTSALNDYYTEHGASLPTPDLWTI